VKCLSELNKSNLGPKFLCTLHGLGGRSTYIGLMVKTDIGKTHDLPTVAKRRDNYTLSLLLCPTVVQIYSLLSQGQRSRSNICTLYSTCRTN